jgi:hypothetical protein
MEPVSLAAAAVSILTPFLPSLLEMAKSGGEKIAASVGEAAGEFTIEKARLLWDKIAGKGKDPKIESVAQSVALVPEDENLQKVLVNLIAAKLDQNPDLADDILQILGGQENVQKVIALRKSWIEGIHMEGQGKKEVRAEDESVIKNVVQKS